MTRKKLKKLIEQSQTSGVLDSNKTYSIADLLKRSELKQYINGLKNYKNKQTVDVITAFRINSIGMLEKLFPDKKIVYKYDPSLILGVRIINDDNVYEFNLKNTFSNIGAYIAKNYD